MLTMTLRIQETPPDNRGGYDLAIDSIEAAAESYGAAYAEAESRVPEGWRVISIMVDRD